MTHVARFKQIGTEFVPFVRDARGELIPCAWAPQAGSQAAFLACSDLEVLMEGTRGGGKLMDFLQHVGSGFGADWTGILLRRTHPQLRDVIRLARKFFKRITPEAQFNVMQSYFEWPTGERLYFAHFDSSTNFDDYIGPSYSAIYWEELTNWPDDGAYRAMLLRRILWMPARALERRRENVGAADR